MTEGIKQATKDIVIIAYIIHLPLRVFGHERLLPLMLLL